MSLNFWRDLQTVLRKELLEIWMMGGGGRGGRIGQLVFFGVFGVLMPWQIGRAWVETPIVMASWGWLPYMMASGVVSDAFAGERERNTLETLLASRLPDQAIFFGKWLAVMVYACGLTWGVLLMSLITVNLTAWNGHVLVYAPVYWLIIGLFSVLGSGLAASAGVLISLRSPTVRQAAQTLSLAVLALAIPLFLFPMLPNDWQMTIAREVQGWPFEQIAWAVAGALAVVDGGLLLVARARFQRAKLI